MKLVPITELRLSSKLYPRLEPDEEHVGRLADAIRAGCKMPAIVIEVGTKIIVDGIHRYHAYRRVYGSIHRMLVCEKHYESEAELFEDAVRLNRTHGLPICRFDHQIIVERATALGLSESSIRDLLLVSTSRMETLLKSAFQKPVQPKSYSLVREPATRSDESKPTLCISCGQRAISGSFKCGECLSRSAAKRIEPAAIPLLVGGGCHEPIGFYAEKIISAIRYSENIDKQTVESLQGLFDALEEFFHALPNVTL